MTPDTVMAQGAAWDAIAPFSEETGRPVRECR